MSGGYEVSAFCRHSYLDAAKMDALPPRPMPDWLQSIYPGRGRAFTMTDLSAVLTSPAKPEIEAWRDRLAAKYSSQLNEQLWWDEASTLVQAEVVWGTSVSAMYAAALAVAVLGPEPAAARLAGQVGIPADERAVWEDTIARRGYTSAYTQLLHGATTWLPFRQDIVIEDTDWRGSTSRFGSVITLAAQADDLRRWTAAAEPGAAAWPAGRLDSAPPTVLAGAWQCSDCVSRLARVAAAQHLPMTWSD